MTYFLSSRGFITTRTTYRFQATIRFSLTHSLFQSTLNCYRPTIMSPVQVLPSFNQALHPDHYKTVLPNLLYPSRPTADIPWSGSSTPLLFSVSQTIFFFVFLLQPYSSFALRKPCVQRRQSLLVLLTFKLAKIFPRFDSDTDVKR